MSLAVIARLLKAWVAPTAARRTTLELAPPAVIVSALGVTEDALSTVDARSMTADAPLAASVVSVPSVTAPV